MNRPIRVLSISTASVAIAALLLACGTEKLKVAKSDPTHAGAVLFSQRCSGCHTLSYAATHGSSTNARTREITNGPNFNVRCERPITRVLYAIENGGFSGAIMPQNIVVSQDAMEVAQFVATYAGRQASTQPGATPCIKQPIGSLPTPASTASAAAVSQAKSSKKTGAASIQGGPPRSQSKAARSQLSGNQTSANNKKRP